MKTSPILRAWKKLLFSVSSIIAICLFSFSCKENETRMERENILDQFGFPFMEVYDQNHPEQRHLLFCKQKENVQQLWESTKPLLKIQSIKYHEDQYF